MALDRFPPDIIEGLAHLLGDANSGTQIEALLREARIPDSLPSTKWKRLDEAFRRAQQASGNGDPIGRYIKAVLAPGRWINRPDDRDRLRISVNELLAHVGLTLTVDLTWRRRGGRSRAAVPVPVPAPAPAPVPSLVHSPSIFLGHGRSGLWRELKDELEAVGLDVHEFSSLSSTGVTTVSRLEGMLDECGFAVILLTPDDATADGELRARQNVIHEVGLFQGRYGFRKVAVVLVPPVEPFSNIEGLGQIRESSPRAMVHEVVKQLRREYPATRS